MKKLSNFLLTIFFVFFVVNANAQSTKNVGVRYWHSEGETQWSHCASTACGGGVLSETVNGVTYVSYGDPTSELTYSDTKAKILEIYGDWSLPQNDTLVISAKIGSGSGDGGSFRDKDWVKNPTSGANQTFSDTLSSTEDTKVNYYILDFGKTYNYNKSKIKPYVGYVRYKEKLNAYGLTYLEDDLSYYNDESSGVYSAANGINVISNEITWTGFRIGSEFEYPINPKTSFTINASYVLNADADNKDSHHFRNDLGSVPNIFNKGEGDGWMLDVIGDYKHSESLVFGLGYRYWKFETDSGTTTFGPNHTPALPNRSLYSERSGLIASVSYKY
jgi:hypothetical protein